LADAGRIALDPTRAACPDVDTARQPLVARPCLNPGCDALHQVVQIERCEVELAVAGLELGKVENVVKHCEQALRRLLQRLSIAALRVVERACEQKLGHGDDRAHGGPQLMTCKREEFGLGLLRCLRQLSCLALRLQGIDKALDLRKEIVRPKILGTHDWRRPLGSKHA
jgi:hypothetical protein